MSVQIIHCSDLHLDKNFNISDPLNAQIRKKDLEDNFESIIQYAIRNRPDLFIIGGDVFDRTLPSNASRVFLVRQLRKIREAGIQAIMIGGNHDVPRNRQSPTLAIDVLAPAGLARVFSDSYQIQHEVIELNGKSISIGGKSYNSLSDQYNPLKGVQLRNCDYNILVIHGSLVGLNVDPGTSFMANYNPFNSVDIPDGIQYLALGHYHNFFERDYKSCKIVNPGSIEKLSWPERNEQKGFVWAELSESKSRVEFIPLACRAMELQEINISPSTNNDTPNDINEIIRESFFPFRDREKIFKVIVRGKISQDQCSKFKISKVYEESAKLFFSLEIDTVDLLVEGYGRVYMDKIESPTDGFVKRLDRLISQTNDQEEQKFLDRIKSLGLEYLERASI